jgi:hypothetical protein
VFDNMEQQIVAVSSNRTYRFHWRQVYYRMRPIVMDQAGEILRWNNFSQKLVRRYLKEHGDEPMAYRDSRGTFYMPHTGESFPLGTLEVERFVRPRYSFNKILVVEKEGFFEALKADRWPERHDCALLTSKGQPTDAARDLIDLIGESDEPVKVFLIHDCDAAGTIIFQSFQDETEARPKRSIEIVNLGLDVEEAMGLASGRLVDIEDVSYEKKQPVARYVRPHQAEWLQTHRVELNAFTTAEFIEWLDEKMEPFKSKVVPPADHMSGRLRETIEQRVRDRITATVLAEAGIEDRVGAAMAGLAGEISNAEAALPGNVASALESEPAKHWTELVSTVADTVAAKHRDKPKQGCKAGPRAKD